MQFLSFLILLGMAAPLAAQPVDLAPGIAHYNARRWAEAHAFFANATKAQPRNVDAVIWYGRTLLSENKAGDAEDWFEKATELAPRSRSSRADSRRPWTAPSNSIRRTLTPASCAGVSMRWLPR